MESPTALLEFVNREGLWRKDDIKRFYIKHNIRHGLELDGVCVYTRTFFAKKISFSFYSEKELSLNFPREPWKSWVPLYDSSIMFPEDPHFSSELGCVLDISVSEFRCFLDKCISNYIDLSFVNKFLNRDHLNIELRPSGDVWRPHVVINNEGGYYTTFDHYIAETQILHFLLKGEGEIFSRIRKCPVCHKFFLPKSLKKKFCSDKCRGAYHYAVEH